MGGEAEVRERAGISLQPELVVREFLGIKKELRLFWSHSKQKSGNTKDLHPSELHLLVLTCNT